MSASEHRTPNTDPLLFWAMAAVTALMVCVAATFKEYSPDVPLHLKLGEIILHERHIPDKAVFLFTNAEYPWLDHEWLFQVMTYAIHQATGIGGLIAWRMGLALLIAGLMWRAAGNAHPLAKGVAMLFAAPVIGTRLCIRPELLTLLFLAVCLVGLERWDKRWLYVLPAVFVVWANVHAFFLGGLALIFIYAMCATAEGLRRSEARPVARELWLLLACCIAACFVNPFFHRGAIYPITELIELGDRRKVFFGAISELASPFERAGQPGDDFRAYRMLVYLTAISFAANARGFRWVHLAGAAATGLASFRVGRNIGLFAVVAGPVLAHNLSGFGAWLAGRMRERTTLWLKWACCGLAACASLVLAREIVSDRYYARLQTVKRFGVGWSDWVYPKRAADFLEEAGVTGRLFNDFETGSYLIWRAHPRRRVFINGNTSFYPPEFFIAYQKVKSGEISPSQAARKHGLDGFLLSHFSGSEAVVRELVRHGGWRLAYFDELGCLFLRKDSPVANAAEPDLTLALPDERLDYEWGALRALRACGLLPRREVVPLSRMMRAKFLLAAGRAE
ncbi:MAG: hypothetical protein FJ278_11565, partial [Planctomycetes bacterium]|nr:hypothetical protein [Planctomycetota bacterium]